jgi:hypothetical protein
MRAAAWIISGALLCLAGVFLGHLYVTVPAAEADIVLISAICAGAVAAVVFIAVVYVRDEIADRRMGEDADEHVRPLRTGSRAAERAMFQFHRAHGLLLDKRSSVRTRRIARALDSLPVRHPWLKAVKHRLRAGWVNLTSWGRQAVTAAAVAREVHVHEPRHAAPKDWDDPMPPPAPPMPPMGADEPGFLTTPEPGLRPLPEEGTASLYLDDSTIWRGMQAIPAAGEVTP